MVPCQVRHSYDLNYVVYHLNHAVIRDEARATAASSALSRILQGAVKLPSKTKQGADGATQNNLHGAGGGDEFQVYHNQDMLVGDVKFERKVWQEEGSSRTGPGVGEGVVGQGSRGGNKGAGGVELIIKARGSLFSNSKQGGDSDNAGVISVKKEVGGEDLLPHGIQEMEDFGKWSPRWSRREDFGIREEEDFARGFHNLGI